METIKKIIKVAIIGAVIGAIIGTAIYLTDTIPFDSVWGDVVFRPNPNKSVDIIFEWMLIGALAVPFAIWMTGNQRY